MLEIVSISKSFGQTRALQDVSLTVNTGEIISLLGPSGCGKSTLLAIVAGLETPDAGEVRWAGQSLGGVPPHRRHFGLMFQDYTLFPHRDVFENIAFGLRMQGLDKTEIEKHVREAMALVNLAGFEKRDVNTLSGGEAQRVALARALAPRPRLLMLDEPLGALDRTLREELLDELTRLLRRSDLTPLLPLPPREDWHGGSLTTLYVTHDQEEAFALADRVAVMRAGRIVQVGAPEEVYAHPASPFVARFLGLTNLLEATPDQAGTIATALGPFHVASARTSEARRAPSASELYLLIRPDAARLSANGDGLNRLQAQVVERSFRGHLIRLTVQAQNGLHLDFEFPMQPLPTEGQRVNLFLDPERLTLVNNTP